MLRSIHLFILSIVILFMLPLHAQQYIGCRMGDGWAETPMLRKTVTLSKKDLSNGKLPLEVRSFGYHEVYVNGVKVGDRVLQPAVSQLDKHVLYVTYELSPYLREGKNELLLWIGQGWGRVYGTPAAVYARLLREQNGVVAKITETDKTWQASPSGYRYTGSWQPLQFGGERYDARVKPDWRPATRYEAPDVKVSRQEFKGNRILDTIAPETVERLTGDTLLLDFGRVITGWFQADFQPLQAGSEVTMEYLDHRQAVPPHTESDIYVAKGSGEERFTNRFHYHAFRYVHVIGADIRAARALPVSALNPDEASTFECSDPRLNTIHDFIQYTLQCLTLSGYMVDCPHLERMGYGGDGNSSTMTLQTMFDVRDTYHNWLMAWDDAMEPDGELPYVAPAFRTGGGPYWSGFIIKAPWRTYLNYGDFTAVSQHYHKMKQWLQFIEQHSEDEILQPWPDNERHTWFLADWLAPKGVDIQGESVLHVTSCFLSECLGDMVQMAIQMGLYDDAQTFAERRSRLNAAIHRHFYHPETHTYGNGTPLDQSYALLMNIPPDGAIAAQVKAKLLADCYDKYNTHFAVGLVGVPVFTEWCIRERQTDLMATMLRQPDYPGYLNMINNGATTTWESWDGERSRVHNCYNGVGVWFYQALAGIRPDPEHPGYEHFFVDPQPCKGVEWVRATKPTPHGTIRVEVNGSKLQLTVSKGTTATVFPGTDRERTLKAGEWILALQETKPMDIGRRVEAVLHNPNYVAVVSHRGDWRNWPENSIPAIESAIEMGVDMVEIDVKMTRDSVLVLCHDWTIDRTTNGSGAIKDYTYEQLMAFDLNRGHGISIPGLKIPTLRQALEVCKDRVLVNVDHGFDYYDQVLALTEELGVTGQVIIKSGRPRDEVESVMNRHPQRMIYMPVVSASAQMDTTAFNDFFVTPPVAFELCFGTLDEHVVAAARKVTAAKSKVWVNTLWGSLCGNHDDDRAYTNDNPDEVYGPILDLGANIIQTDRPEFLIKYLERKGKRVFN